jgi:integrase
VHPKGVEAAKVERLTLHDGRHTHAVNLLRAGASPQLVKTHLGHKDTNLVWRVYGNYITDDRDYALMDSKAELLADDERLSADTTAVDQEPARRLSH